MKNVNIKMENYRLKLKNSKSILTFCIVILIFAFYILMLPLEADASVINKSPNYLGSLNGLVGYWTMDGSKVNWKTGAVTDSSGRGNTGTITNMATSTGVAIGKIGQALSFDGVDDFVAVADNNSLQLATALTVSAWFKTSDTTTDKGIIRKDTSSGTRYLYGIVLNNVAGTGKFYGQYYNGTNFQVASTNAVNDGNWHQAIMTISGTILTFYIDGASQGTTVISGTQGVPNGELDIGALPPYVGSNPRTGFINSKIDDVRIYNRALSATEIQTLYNTGATTKFNVPPTKYSTTGLVGYWTMDGSKVNWKTGAVMDSSGWGNTGYVTSTATSSMATSSASRIGKIGQALNFNGSNDLVKVGTPSSLNITGALTISGWIYPRTFGANVRGRIVDKENDFVNGYSLSLFNPGTSNQINTMALFINASGGNLNCVASANSIVLNQWQYIAVTLDSSKFCIPYVNGTKATTSPGMTMGSLPGSGSNIFTIGNNSGNTRDFDGLIDEVRVYNRALTATEIKTLYNIGVAKFNVSPTKYLTSGLVGYWTMDGSKVNWNTGAVTDSSGFGNTGTITNMATSTGVAIGKIGQALSFDGTDDILVIGDKDAFDAPTSYTIGAWIYPRTFGGGSLARIFDKRNNGATGFDFFVCNSGCTAALAVVHDASNVISSNSNTVDLNIWQYVVVSWDGANATFYVNGVAQGSPALSTVPTANAVSISIGNETANDRDFNGLIDDVRIYNRALSADEVLKLYNSGR